MGCTQWGGWEVWVHGVSAIICISELIIVRAVVSYYVCCRNYMYIHILIIYIYNVQYCNKNMDIVVIGSLIYSSFRYIYCYNKLGKHSIIYLFSFTK